MCARGECLCWVVVFTNAGWTLWWWLNLPSSLLKKCPRIAESLSVVFGEYGSYQRQARVRVGCGLKEFEGVFGGYPQRFTAVLTFLFKICLLACLSVPCFPQ